MATKVLFALTIVAAMAAFIMALPAVSVSENSYPEVIQEQIEEIKEAMVKQDVRVGLDGQGRLLFSQNLFNLSATLASAPNDTASFTKIPLVTVLLAGTNLFSGLTG